MKSEEVAEGWGCRERRERLEDEGRMMGKGGGEDAEGQRAGKGAGGRVRITTTIQH